MIDIRSTKEYRNKLAKGVVDQQLLSRKDTYTLSALLPPITDYIYNPVTDTWNRYVEKEEETIIKEHNLQTTDRWNNYGFSFRDEQQEEEEDTQDGPFWITKTGHIYFKVEPLENGDTTCYIEKIYHGGLFERIFGSMMIIDCDEDDITDTIMYMRLRCVCKTFRDIIDKSSNLLHHRGKIVKNVVIGDNLTDSKEYYAPEEIQKWITIYETPEMCYYNTHGENYVNLLCDSLDLCRKYCPLSTYTAFSNRILRIRHHGKPFPMPFIRVLNKLCVDERQIDKTIDIVSLDKYSVSLHFILVKDESKIVRVRKVEGRTCYYDVTYRYGLNTSENIDNSFYECLKDKRKQIFPY